MFVKKFLKKWVARVVYMNFAWCLFNKEHWHYAVLRRLNPVNISFTRECKTVIVDFYFFFHSLMETDKSLMLLWDSWCHDGQNRGVHTYNQFVTKFTVSKWKGGKFVKLFYLNYVCTQTFLNKLLWICPPLSLSLRAKYSGKVNSSSSTMGRVYWSPNRHLW